MAFDHPLLCKCDMCVNKLPAHPFATRPDAPVALAKPGKRVKSLANYIRGKTKQNREVARFMVDVMRDPDCAMGHRMEAAKWLVDRSEGRAVERAVMLKLESDATRISVTHQIGGEELAELIRSLSPANPNTHALSVPYEGVVDGILVAPAANTDKHGTADASASLVPATDVGEGTEG
jgi:hypothetical protein